MRPTRLRRRPSAASPRRRRRCSSSSRAACDRRSAVLRLRAGRAPVPSRSRSSSPRPCAASRSASPGPGSRATSSTWTTSPTRCCAPRPSPRRSARSSTPGRGRRRRTRSWSRGSGRSSAGELDVRPGEHEARPWDTGCWVADTAKAERLLGWTARYDLDAGLARHARPGRGGRMSAEVSVVVPLYRTADALPELYRRIVAALEGRTFELLLVDDACPDGSGRAAAELAADDERVHVLSLAAQRGPARRRAARVAGRRSLGGRSRRRSPGSARGDTAPPRRGPGRGGPGRVRRAARPLRVAPRLLTSRIYKRTLALVAGVPADAGIFMALDRSVAERLVALGGRRRPSLVAMVGCLRVPMTPFRWRACAAAVRPVELRARGRLRLGVRTIAWALAWRLRGAR